MYNCVYINHNGRSINLCSPPFYVEDFYEMKSYKWNYTLAGGAISDFQREKIKAYSLRIGYYNADESSFVQLLDEFYSMRNEDIEEKKAGKLFINGYYCEMFFVGKTVEFETKGIEVSAFTLLAPTAEWYREIETIRFQSGSNGGSSEGVTYPHDYPYGYANPNESITFTNSSSTKTAFRLIVYGVWNNPSITIAGHVYNVNEELLVNEQLVIDSIKQEIFKMTADNQKINCFSKRNRDSNKKPFEKIPSGECSVTFTGEHTFMLTLIEVRSCPK